MNVAIILAAGESRRMGQPKQLLPFGGKTMLECVIDAFQSPRVDEIRVVLGYKADEIAGKIGSLTNPRREAQGAFPPYKSGAQNCRAGMSNGLPAVVRIVKNDRYPLGMFTSMQAGLRDLP